MNLFWHPCRRRREICLFAAGATPEQDRPELEQHLAACPACRAYYSEIKTLAAPLANWEDHFAHIEPTQAMQSRWAAAIQASTKSTPSPSSTPPAHKPLLPTLCLNLWREILCPSRRVWLSLAATWLVLLAVNARLSDPPVQMAGLHSSSPSEIMQSWEVQTRVLAELTQPALRPPPAVTPPAAPADAPRPRSERKPDWHIV
jgi:anti-sigma factor RsiW